MIKTIIENYSEDSCNRAGQILKEGGIVAFPTDTVYGLGAIYTDEMAVEKIFEAKGRDEGKPLSILVSDAAQVELLAEEVTDDGRKLMEAFWPGALTLIFRCKEGISKRITAGGKTIGIRMPNCKMTTDIIKAAGVPLAAPSANISGRRSSVSADDVIEDLDGRIEMIVDGGICPVGVSSTVIDMTSGDVRILREGTVTEQMIKEVLKQA